MRPYFWRHYEPHLTRDFIGDVPYGAPTVLLLDGEPVSDIEWMMWSAFRRFDNIVRDAHRALEKIVT